MLHGAPGLKGGEGLVGTPERLQRLTPQDQFAGDQWLRRNSRRRRLDGGKGGLRIPVIEPHRRFQQGDGPIPRRLRPRLGEQRGGAGRGAARCVNLCRTGQVAETAGRGRQTVVEHRCLSEASLQLQVPGEVGEDGGVRGARRGGARRLEPCEGEPVMLLSRQQPAGFGEDDADQMLRRRVGRREEQRRPCRRLGLDMTPLIDQKLRVQEKKLRRWRRESSEPADQRFRRRHPALLAAKLE